MGPCDYTSPGEMKARLNGYGGQTVDGGGPPGSWAPRIGAPAGSAPQPDGGCFPCDQLALARHRAGQHQRERIIGIVLVVIVTIAVWRMFE